jgi:hypothetical protein
VQDLLMSNGLQLEPIGHLLQRQAGPFVQVNRVAIDD